MGSGIRQYRQVIQPTNLLKVEGILRVNASMLTINAICTGLSIRAAVSLLIGLCIGYCFSEGSARDIDPVNMMVIAYGRWLYTCSGLAASAKIRFVGSKTTHFNQDSSGILIGSELEILGEQRLVSKAIRHYHSRIQLTDWLMRGFARGFSPVNVNCTVVETSAM